MKNHIFKLVIGALLGLTFQTCAQQPEESTNGIIASKDGYELTEKHFADYLTALHDYEVETGDRHQAETIIKAELKTAFLEDPKNILKELNTLSTTDVPVPELPIPSSNRTLSFLAQGHKVVRQKLNGDIGQMQFNNQAVNDFRTFMANSRMIATSSRGGGGGGVSTNNQIQFCADGSYVEYRSAHLGVTAPGIEASGYDEDTIPGYWEVASLPNGMLIILFYSTHPLMLEDSLNGLLPLPVAQYATDFVTLPNGDGYRRNINYCN
ncbi:hypothetical protein [uncultured Dokdonia sp.]|uniref:hypothetical protein n=1 Tax=uncultured Dokdonia sp. TaxID=575653 RepID=UPI00260C9D3D|nr:hypothetical protein [uncultured Dokdonia sp.]